MNYGITFRSSTLHKFPWSRGPKVLVCRLVDRSVKRSKETVWLRRPGQKTERGVEPRSVKDTWRWSLTLVESRPWGRPFVGAHCSWTRTTGVDQHLASPGATPSQKHLTLSVSSHRELTMGAPIRRCSVRLQQVCEVVRLEDLERFSGVTRFAAPADLSLSVLQPTFYTVRERWR